MSTGNGQILVVGMHRSGTSALSGLLNQMGAYFGPPDQQLPTKVANPRGYWERWDVVLANDALLAKNNHEWRRVAAYTPACYERMDTSFIREKLSPIVADYNQHHPWFVKDPRICLTLPCWLSLLDRPVCILVARDPLQVAFSLERRKDCSTHAGLALWEAYTSAALWNSRGCPRMLLHYEQLLENPIQELTRLLEFLGSNGVTGMTLPPDGEVRSWLDANLQREQIRSDAIPDFLNSRQKELYDAMADGSALSIREPWSISSGGLAALKAYESLHVAVVDENKALRQRNDQLDAEVNLVRAFKQDILTWNQDLETCVDSMSSSITYRWSRAMINGWRRLTGRPQLSSPVDRMRDIVAAQKNIKGMGEPEA